MPVLRFRPPEAPGTPTLQWRFEKLEKPVLVSRGRQKIIFLLGLRLPVFRPGTMLRLLFGWRGVRVMLRLSDPLPASGIRNLNRLSAVCAAEAGSKLFYAHRVRLRNAAGPAFYPGPRSNVAGRTDFCWSCSMLHCRGFLSKRQRRIVVPWRNRPPEK